MSHEAWVDKMTTSSTFSPPLTIPYGLMAAGMTLLVAQLLLQVAARVAGRKSVAELANEAASVGTHP